jgi:DNA-binding NarL/FixJ family response regulator
MKARVFVVEDHPITRQGLEMLINSQADMAVCGSADDAVMAFQGIRDTAPDIAITDLSLKGTDGLDLVKQVRQTHPNLKVLVLSMHDESLYAQRALRAGAQGYVMKAEATERLLVAVRQVLSGRIYLSESESSRAIATLSGTSNGIPKTLEEQLSDRELEVFRWIGRGSSVREIADRLQLSVKTIETHCSRIKLKLQIANSRELTRRAIHWLVTEER